MPPGQTLQCVRTDDAMSSLPKRPLAHASHTLWPDLAWKRPGGHLTHEVSACSKRPAAHAVQLAAPLELVVPATQRSHDPIAACRW